MEKPRRRGDSGIVRGEGMRRVVAGRPGWSYNPAPAQIAMAVGTLPAAGRPRRGTSPRPTFPPSPRPTIRPSRAE